MAVDGLIITNITPYELILKVTEQNSCNSNNLKGTHILPPNSTPISFDVSGHSGQSCTNALEVWVKHRQEGELVFKLVMSDGNPAYIQDIRMSRPSLGTKLVFRWVDAHKLEFGMISTGEDVAD